MTTDSSPDRSCRCRICEPDVDAEYDEQERHALEVVLRHGWLVTNIEPGDGIPGWSFTTGLTHSFGWPELVMTGLPGEVLHACLNSVGELARRGVHYVPDSRHGDVIDGYEVRLQPVEPAWNPSLVGWSRWFAQRQEPWFAQVVWPDKAGCLPGDEGYDHSIGHLQPTLTVPPRNHTYGPWRAWAAESAWPGRERTDGLVFVSRSVMEADAPVLVVAFDDDGDWSFTDGGDADDASQVALTHVFHVLMKDPALDRHIGLGRGQAAWRTDVSAPWQFGGLDEPKS